MALEDLQYVIWHDFLARSGCWRNGPQFESISCTAFLALRRGRRRVRCWKRPSKDRRRRAKCRLSGGEGSSASRLKAFAQFSAPRLGGKRSRGLDRSPFGMRSLGSKHLFRPRAAKEWVEFARSPALGQTALCVQLSKSTRSYKTRWYRWGLSRYSNDYL